MKMIYRSLMVLMLTVSVAACGSSIVGPQEGDDETHNPDSGNHNPDSGH